MTQEEKAKAYDNIIEKANKMHNENCEVCQICIEELIPELKESEDERIRQGLIKLVKMSSEVGGFALHKWEADEMLAWLERQGEQKPVDNIESSAFKDKLLELFQKFRYIKGVSTNGDVIEYVDAHIQELIDTIQNKHWSEEDESWFKELELMALSFSNDDSYRKKFFDWLKSIKERVQPKQEWSEEDEKMLENVIWHLRNSVNNGDVDQSADELEEWLKSLRERYAWKPSDEQIDVLCKVTHCVSEIDSKILQDLIKQLEVL